MIYPIRWYFGFLCQSILSGSYLTAELKYVSPNAHFSTIQDATKVKYFTADVLSYFQFFVGKKKPVTEGFNQETSVELPRLVFQKLKPFLPLIYKWALLRTIFVFQSFRSVTKIKVIGQ
jgi:hypothetical protein